MFIGGSFLFGSPFYDPFYDGFYGYPPYGYPPYGYPPYGYPYPTDEYPPPDYPPPSGAASEPGWTEPPAETAQAEPQAVDPLEVSYGLLQIHGVPDGTAIDLDGRFWLTAQRLDQRWLALPRGSHTLTFHLERKRTVERHVDVQPGRSVVVRVG